MGRVLGKTLIAFGARGFGRGAGEGPPGARVGGRAHPPGRGAHLGEGAGEEREGPGKKKGKRFFGVFLQNPFFSFFFFFHFFCAPKISQLKFFFFRFLGNIKKPHPSFVFLFCTF